MEASVEAPESRLAPWVTGLIVASVVLSLITFLMGLFEGSVNKAVFFGSLALALAIPAWITSRGIHARKAGASVALVVAIIAFAAGLQSAILGTGQINPI